MSLQLASFAIPAKKTLQPRNQVKYDLSKLRAGTEDCFVETEVVSVKKVISRLTSAVSSYRSRTGDKLANFTVRSFKLEDGKDAVGVWRLADKTQEQYDAEQAAKAAKAAKADAPAAAPAADTAEAAPAAEAAV